MPVPDNAMEQGKTYLCGYPLKRTYAPFVHNTLTRLAGATRTYEKYETQDLASFLELTKEADFAGSAVTMPYKVEILKHLDDFTEDGRTIGACNTILVRRGADGQRNLVGHNTDSVGVFRSLQAANDTHLKSGTVAPAMMVGAGGAARAALYALTKWMSCSPIYVLNRDDDEVQILVDSVKESASGFHPKIIHVKTVEQAKQLAAPVYTVNAVPDFEPTTDGEKLARQILEEFLNKDAKGTLLEMCYFPHLSTTVSRLATTLGHTVVTGEQAMIWQAVAQQVLWLDCAEEDLNLEELFNIVKRQIESDQLTGAEPPQK